MLALGDEDVGGLDVAVDDASCVGCIEGIGDLDAERQDRVQLHGVADDQMLKRGAVEELHDEEGASGVLADVVDGADIGMIQGRGGFGFTAEPLQRLMILSKVVG